MPLSLNNIDIDLKKGLAIAHQVAEEEEALRKAYQEGLSAIEDLTAFWKGDNAARFIALLQERVEDLNARANVLGELHSAIYDTVMVYDQQQRDQWVREQQAEQKRQAKSKK